jgi:hypothetical protein
MTDTPQLTHEEVAEIAQEHEQFLSRLESLAISAIASGNWRPVHDLISEVETWQGEQVLVEEKQTDSINHLWVLVFPKESS